MIVLRITARGTRREHRSEKREVALGADAASDVVLADVGWAAREAVLVHHGTDVELRRPDGRGALRLRVGDAVRLGHARVTLVGLLPLPEPTEGDLEGAAAPTGAPVFGGYEEDWPPARPFALVDELPRPTAAAASAAGPVPPPRLRPRCPARTTPRSDGGPPHLFLRRCRARTTARPRPTAPPRRRGRRPAGAHRRCPAPPRRRFARRTSGRS